MLRLPGAARHGGRHRRALLTLVGLFIHNGWLVGWLGSVGVYKGGGVRSSVHHYHHPHTSIHIHTHTHISPNTHTYLHQPPQRRQRPLARVAKGGGDLLPSLSGCERGGGVGGGGGDTEEERLACLVGGAEDTAPVVFWVGGG